MLSLINIYFLGGSIVQITTNKMQDIKNKYVNKNEYDGSKKEQLKKCQRQTLTEIAYKILDLFNNNEINKNNQTQISKSIKLAIECTQKTINDGGKYKFKMDDNLQSKELFLSLIDPIQNKTEYISSWLKDKLEFICCHIDTSSNTKINWGKTNFSDAAQILNGWFTDSGIDRNAILTYIANLVMNDSYSLGLPARIDDMYHATSPINTEIVNFIINNQSNKFDLKISLNIIRSFCKYGSNDENTRKAFAMGLYKMTIQDNTAETLKTTINESKFGNGIAKEIACIYFFTQQEILEKIKSGIYINNPDMLMTLVNTLLSRKINNNIGDNFMQMILDGKFGNDKNVIEALINRWIQRNVSSIHSSVQFVLAILMGRLGNDAKLLKSLTDQIYMLPHLVDTAHEIMNSKDIDNLNGVPSRLIYISKIFSDIFANIDKDNKINTNWFIDNPLFPETYEKDSKQYISLFMREIMNYAIRDLTINDAQLETLIMIYVEGFDNENIVRLYNDDTIETSRPNIRKKIIAMLEYIILDQTQANREKCRTLLLAIMKSNIFKLDHESPHNAKLLKDYTQLFLQYATYLHIAALYENTDNHIFLLTPYNVNCKAIILETLKANNLDKYNELIDQNMYFARDVKIHYIFEITKHANDEFRKFIITMFYGKPDTRISYIKYINNGDHFNTTIINNLLKIAQLMQNNETVMKICGKLAIDGIVACEDRTLLAYLKMLIVMKSFTNLNAQPIEKIINCIQLINIFDKAALVATQINADNKQPTTQSIHLFLPLLKKSNVRHLFSVHDFEIFYINYLQAFYGQNASFTTPAFIGDALKFNTMTQELFNTRDNPEETQQILEIALKEYFNVLPLEIRNLYHEKMNQVDEDLENSNLSQKDSNKLYDNALQDVINVLGALFKKEQQNNPVNVIQQLIAKLETDTKYTIKIDNKNLLEYFQYIIGFTYVETRKYRAEEMKNIIEGEVKKLKDGYEYKVAENVNAFDNYFNQQKQINNPGDRIAFNNYMENKVLTRTIFNKEQNAIKEAIKYDAYKKQYGEDHFSKITNIINTLTDISKALKLIIQDDINNVV